MGLTIYDYEYKKNGRPHGAHFTLGSRKFKVYADRLYIMTTREGMFLVSDGEEYKIPKSLWAKLKDRLVKAPVSKDELAKYERFYDMLLDKQFRATLKSKFAALARSLNCTTLPPCVTATGFLLTAQNADIAIQLEINNHSCSLRYWTSKKVKFFGSDLDIRFQRLAKSLAKMLIPFDYRFTKPTKVSGLVFTDKTPAGKPYMAARGYV